MSEYAKMKNAELEGLLKARNLPTGGKKADMVERLTKDDESKKAKTTIDPEDEIDWDDDAELTKPAVEPAATDAIAAAAEATSEPAAAAIKAGGLGPVANPQAVPNQVADIDPSKTNDLSVKAPGEAGEVGETNATEKDNEPAAQKAEEAPVDFSRGLAATNIDDEIEKRKARAKKFGLKIEDDEGLKKLERMKKFGETTAPKGLDEALPERARKRGREGGDDGGRHKRRGGGRFGGRGGRGNRDGGSERDNKTEQKRNTGGNGSWMSEADRAKADARKNRFASST